MFASWVGNRLLGSHPMIDVSAASGAPGEVASQSFFLDPATGKQVAIAEAAWRPIVDPKGHWAVLWSGTVQVDPDVLTPLPATGSLVLRGFDSSDGVESTGPAAPILDGPVSEFDVRWDETGTWLAVWRADATDPTIGRLSLVHIDPATGHMSRPHGAPQDVTAMPGFSIANGRLAWATPPGQSGEGSRIQIVAWSDDAVGAVESGPQEDVVVIH